MKKTKIAIFGSASHIAKGLIYNFLRGQEYPLHLYTRSADSVRSFLKGIGEHAGNGCVIRNSYKGLFKSSYGVIINCVGAGTLNKLQGDYSKYFTIIEEYDNLAIRYLRENSARALYISLSSGAVYGRNFSAPVDENTVNSIRVNHVAKEDYYAIARLNAEAKHRAFKELRIVDLRVFSYFSRFIDLEDSYFIVEVMNCILKNKMLVTNGVNFVRDYIHPQDLYSMVQRCIRLGKLNTAFDATSARPVEKKEILDYFSREYGLKYKINRSLSHISPTGPKNIYCSNYNNAGCIGYSPVFSSMDAIKQESRYLLERLKRK